MNPQQLHNPAEVQAFNPALFAQQSRSFEGVNQAMHQAAPELHVAMGAQPAEAPVDLRAQLSVDINQFSQDPSATMNQASRRAWTAEREAEKQKRFAEMAYFVLQTQFLFDQAARVEEKEKEKVNA